ncbi:hypothetical protein Fot_35306 [Forsythia ovata]|uniref:Uncharacterized protein n=1 Tax=Forsythia ovata TaxID=205694 RepID=A0ABD1SNY4_9LAMI
MDINDRHFDDPDSDVNDIGKIVVEPIMILRKRDIVIGDKGGRVVDERGTLLPRLSIPSTAPNPASPVPPVVETVGDVSSSFPTSSTVPPVAFIPLVVETVGNVSSSLPPVVEVGDDSSFLSPKTSTSLLVDV